MPKLVKGARSTRPAPIYVWIATAFCILLASPTQAQNAPTSGEEMQARAFFLAAVEAIERGRFQEGIEAVQEAENRLGKSNAQLTALSVRGHFGLGNYIEADAALQRLFEMSPSPRIQQQIAPLIVQIDRLRKEQVEARSIESERQRVETELASRCIDGPSCLSAASRYSGKTDERSRASLLKFTARSCETHQHIPACEQLVKNEAIGKAARFKSARLLCNLDGAKGCVVASKLIINRGRFDSSLGAAKTDALQLSTRGCELGSTQGCMDAMIMHGGAYGFPKNRKLAKEFRTKGCGLAEASGRFDTMELRLNCSKEIVRWSKARLAD